jgi:hypothetical protein
MGFAMMWLDSYTSKGAKQDAERLLSGNGTSHVGTIDRQNYRTAAPHPVAVGDLARAQISSGAGVSLESRPTRVQFVPL